MKTFADKLLEATNEDKQVNELYKHELKKQFNKLKSEDYDCQLLTDSDLDYTSPVFNTSEKYCIFLMTTKQLMKMDTMHIVTSQ